MSVALPLSEVLGLWRGDALSSGYCCWTLAFEVCKRTCPPTFDALKDTLYPPYQKKRPKGQPGLPELVKPEIDKDVLEMLERAYNLWLKSGRPTR